MLDRGDLVVQFLENRALNALRGRFRLSFRAGASRGERLRLRQGQREHRPTGAMMLKAELKTERIDTEQEAARLAALASTGILDSEPEATYDAITRLTADQGKIPSSI